MKKSSFRLISVIGCVVALLLVFTGEGVLGHYSASATTGLSPLFADGFRPFGLPIELVEQTDPGDWFKVHFDSFDGYGIMWATGEAQFAGWMNYNYVWNQSESPEFPRAFVDYVSTAEVVAWMSDGWPGRLVDDCEWGDGCRSGDYILAKPGVLSAAVCEAPENVVLYVPIYDAILNCPEIPEPKPPCSIVGDFYYHVVGFASIQITGCNQGEGEIEAIWVKAYHLNERKGPPQF